MGTDEPLRKILRQNVLSVMILNMPSEGEMAEAKREKERGDRSFERFMINVHTFGSILWSYFVRCIRFWRYDIIICGTFYVDLAHLLKRG